MLISDDPSLICLLGAYPLGDQAQRVFDRILGLLGKPMRSVSAILAINKTGDCQSAAYCFLRTSTRPAFVSSLP